MADESYIRGLTETIKTKIEYVREQTRKENRDAEIVKAESPNKWMELKDWLNESIGQLNKSVGSNAILYVEDDINEIMVPYLADQRDVTVSFLGFTGQIIAKGILFESAFDTKVEGNHLHYIQDKTPYARKTIEEIGKEILDQAVKA
jgi:predicted Holliday junction resolvase-like endonuclease